MPEYNQSQSIELNKCVRLTCTLVKFGKKEKKVQALPLQVN